jgi:RNA polymerase sigma-70 factor (ECF subfamily)
MMWVMAAAQPPSGPDHAADLMRIYDGAVEEVYRYLRSRCGQRHLAEDLTADTFLAAVGQVQRNGVDEVTVAWLIGIARHKLMDQWRRTARRPEVLVDASVSDGDVGVDDSWSEVIDRQNVGVVLESLGPHHRSALVLRYFDGLPVPEVALHLGRSVHATETLLVRARREFRAEYERQDGGSA